MRQVTKIILHCTATPEGRHHDAADIRRWHMKRGFKDIGYHWLVHIDGTIEPGRQMHVRGAHCKGHNKDSIGICYVGGLDKQRKPKNTLTEEQLTSLFNVIQHTRNHYGDIPLHGHCEFSNKACPSFDVVEVFGPEFCYP